MKNKKISNTLLGGLAALAFLLILGLVGTEDFKSELLTQVRYCDNVAAGIWPDYNNTAQYCDETFANLQTYFPKYARGLDHAY